MSIAPERELSRAEHQQQIVDQFRTDVAQVGNIALFDATIEPGVQSVDHAVTYFINCCAKPDTIFTSNRFEERLDNIDEGLTISIIPSRQRRKSAHNVFFASLKCGDKETRLAVKPLGDFNAWYPAAREQILTQGFRDMGFYTLNALGVLISGDSEPDEQRAYFLTELHDNLTTFESIKPEEWQGMLYSPADNQGMAEMWQLAAREVAFMHDLGLTKHGDLWARNFATSVDEISFMIDFELAEIGVGFDPDAERRHNYSLPDIKDTLRSICLPHDVPGSNYQGLGMIRDADQDTVDWEAVYRSVFFDEYLAIRRKLAKEEGASASREITEELDQLEADVSLYCKHWQVAAREALKRSAP